MALSLLGTLGVIVGVGLGGFVLLVVLIIICNKFLSRNKGRTIGQANLQSGAVNQPMMMAAPQMQPLLVNQQLAMPHPQMQPIFVNQPMGMPQQQLLVVNQPMTTPQQQLMMAVTPQQQQPNTMTDQPPMYEDVKYDELSEPDKVVKFVQPPMTSQTQTSKNVTSKKKDGEEDEDYITPEHI